MQYKKFSRKEILEEQLLRENIRVVLKKALSDRKKLRLQEDKQISAIRALIGQLIMESESEVSPHESTGINVLEDLLKKIVPQIEGDFKTLTTDKKQRDSFRAHILNATENSIAPKSAIYSDDEDGEDNEIDAPLEEMEMEPTPEEIPAGNLGDPMEAPEIAPLEEEEISISVDDADDDEQELSAGDVTALDDDEKLIDIGDVGGAQDADDAFEEIAGQDDTGRNVANMSFQKIEKSIQDSYSLLGDEKDQELFRDYLLTNLKLYFDKFEDELGQGGLSEPTNDEYEAEKDKAPEAEEPGADEEDLGGDEEEDELELEL